MGEREMSIRLTISFLATFAALLSTGCAGITVTKAPSLDTGSSMQGAPWNLAMTRFTVTISRHIIKCGPSIDVKVETMASANAVLDTEQRYLLTSNGWFATSDIKSTLAPTGYATGLNTTSMNAASTIVGNVVGTAAQVAITLASAGVSAPEGKAIEFCTPDLKTAVDTLYPVGGTPLKKQLDKSNAELAVLSANVAMLHAQASVDKDNKTIKAALLQAIADQRVATDDLRKKQTEFAEAIKASSNIQTVTWPTNASEFRRDTPFSVDDAVLKQWISRGVDGPNAKMKMDVYLALYSQPAAGGWSAPKINTKPNLSLGVPVRMPRAAKLVMCSVDPCPPAFPDGAFLTDKQTAADFMVLQTGPIYSIPVAGGAFRAETAKIDMDPNGVPTNLQTAQTAAGAAALSGTVKEAATTLAALPASVRAAELARTKAEKDQIDASIALQTAQQTAGLQGQTAMITAQNNLIAAQNAHSTALHNAALQPIQQETGTYNAHAQAYQAQAALAIAQANAGVVDQTSVLAAQASLITAETTLLNAAAALVKAQAATLP
jgi:hypothetical protein